MKKIVKVLIAVIAFCILLIVSGCFFTVRENQYAVVTQFGRIVRVEDTAGLKWKIPFIQSTSYLPRNIQIYDLYPSDVITSDKKSMISDNYILWQITDPVRFMQTLNGSTATAEDRASVAVYNATKNIISSMSQDEIISARGDRLTQMVTDESNSDIGGYGIVIHKAQIKALDLPDDNKSAVYERMISERNNIAASYRAQGESDAQKIRNDTDRSVSVMQSEARMQADIIIAEGEAQYMQILAEAYDTPEKAEFYNFLRSLDALKASMTGEGNTVILDKDSELVRILYGLQGDMRIE
ncbi:MAG: protease modulator HflC [Lachnospiraceae bacterium]|nr:protease modulator HflC [Lachnospiraceae bacterium]